VACRTLETRAGFASTAIVAGAAGAELAYNRAICGRLALPRQIEEWSLTSLQQRMVKTGGRLVKHPRYYWLFLAEEIPTDSFQPVP
jgi:hypothetical protein